jgi:hypothetical protein
MSSRPLLTKAERLRCPHGLSWHTPVNPRLPDTSVKAFNSFIVVSNAVDQNRRVSAYPGFTRTISSDMITQKAIIKHTLGMPIRQKTIFQVLKARLGGTGTIPSNQSAISVFNDSSAGSMMISSGRISGLLGVKEGVTPLGSFSCTKPSISHPKRTCACRLCVVPAAEGETCS